MFKKVFVSTLFATLTFQANAEPLKEHDLSVLPADVAARVVELQKHGERFEPAIRAIFAASAKPTWRFEGCEHDATLATAELPNS